VTSKLGYEEFNFIHKLVRRKGAYRMSSAVTCIRLAKGRVENIKREIRMNYL